MSISVTISGQDSVSVVSSQPLTDTVEISSISALDPLKTATGSLRNDISNVSGLITSNDSDISSLNTATGVLNTSILELQTATGLLQTATGVLETVTGFFAQTGSKPIIFAQDISTVGGTISADQGTFSEVRGTIKTPIQNDIKSLQLQNLTVTGGNFVGIGTSSPNAELDVSGELRVNGPLNLIESHAYKISNQEWARIKNNTLQIGDLNSNYFSTAIFGNGGLQVITITGDGGLVSDTNVGIGGKLGIGTNLPQAKFHVDGNTILSGVLTVTGDINSPTINSLVQKSETGVLLTSGEIQTNIDAAVTNLVDSAPATLNTLNELAAALGDDQNFSTTTATSLGNLSTATGVLNTNVNALQAVTGSFAQTGTTQDATFSEINLFGDLRFQNSTQGIIFTNNAGIERFGLKVGDSGALGGSNNIMLTNREETGNLLFGTAGTVGGGAGETERMRITHDGKVGIGTTTPRSNLDVSGSVISSKTLAVEGQDNPATNGPAAEIQYRSSDNAGRFYSYDRSTSQYKNVSIGDDYIYAKNDGSVGIGTTSPQEKLHVAGTTLLSGDVSITGNTIITGNVGIGTTSPSDELTVRGAQFNKTHISIGDNTDRLRLGYIHSSSLESSTSAAQIGSSASRELKIAAASNNSSLIKFYTNTGNGSPIERMVIDNSGRIGIGTTSPNEKLHVQESNSSNGTSLTIQNGFGESPKNIKFRYTDNVETARIEGFGRNNSSTLPYLAFHVNQTTASSASNDVAERMRITSSGNVGIGTTNPDKSFVVRGADAEIVLDDTNSTPLLRFRENGSTKSEIKTISQNLIFTAGGTTERMRIASDGDVGIGTDSPSSKLHVNKAGDPNVIFENESNTSLDRNNTLSFNYSDGVGAFIKGTRPSGLSRTGTFLTLGAGGNTERLRIDALGNVGIGTTSPQASLHVNGDTILSGNLTITGTSLVAKNLNVEGTVRSESGRIILHDTTIDGDKVIAAAGNNLRFFTVHGVFGNSVGVRNNRGSVMGMDGGANSSDLGLFCNSIEGISIQDDGDVIVGNGNLGIGTTSPATKLHVNGPITGSTISGGFLFVTGGIGIGHPRPSPVGGNDALLNVAGDVTFQGTLASNTIDSAGGDGYTVENKPFAQFDTLLKLGDHDGSDFATALFSNGGTEAIRITGGNVGIGTTTPQAKLHVAGDTLLSGVATVVNNLQLSGNIQDLHGGDILTFNENDLIVFGKHITAGHSVGIRGSRGDTRGMDQGSTSSDLGIFCNTIEALSIQNDGDVIVNTGNLGIGTTTPTAKLHVAGTTLLSGDVSVTGDITTTGNITSNGVIKAINSDANIAQLEVGRNNSELIEMKVSDSNCFITANQDSDSNGSHGFILDRVFAGSGPSNFVIRKNGSNQARIDTSGNMCIGSGTPAARLHVDGDTLLSGKAVVRNGNFGLNTGDPKATFHIKQRAAANTGGIRITEHNDDNTWSIWANDSSSLFFQHATTSDGSPTSKMFLTSAGVLNVKGDLSLSENDSVFTNKGTSQQTGDAIFHNSISGSNISGKHLLITGNVGIGTNSPSQKLHVAGGKALVEQTSSAGSVIVNRTDGKSTALVAAGAESALLYDSAGFFSIQARSSSNVLAGNGDVNDEVIRIDSAGNIGIGASSPDAQLHVKSTGDAVLKLEADTDNVNENHNPLIQFVQDSGLISANIGFNGNTNSEFTGAIDNAFYIETTPSTSSFGAFQIATNNNASFTIDNNSNVGIGTTSPSAKLEVSGDTILNGHVGIGVFSPQFPLDIGGTNSSTGSTIRIGQNNGGTAIRIGVGGGSSDVVLMRVDGEGASHDGESDSANFGFSMKYMGSLSQNNNALRIISDNQQGTAVNALNIQQDGSIGLNTVSPAARLHVNGDTILSGNLDISGSITPAKDVAFDIGSPTKRFKDLYLSGDSIFLGDTKLSISGDELQTRRGGVVRRAPLRDNLNQTRNLIVTGNAVLGKCSLSANSFVTETGDFTLGLVHRGATVLLQNPAAITITCPALVPGHVTTFIAETQHTASFATGVGMSGLNSFNGASDMAGIFAQAQIIYKSLSGAFLGGNIV